jgi:solute carrier family 25 carnitine/acylcarnitine transporter 20/29
VAAPVLGYGALNALLYMSYNRTLLFLDPTIKNTTELGGTNLLTVFTAGAVGGLAGWVVVTPTELIKCRAQLSPEARSSWSIAQDIWRTNGIRGLYLGGGVTSLRDPIGYGFYFWAYELSKRMMPGWTDDANSAANVTRTLLCGGIAGVVTWTSIFPLDVIKTRIQGYAETQALSEASPLRLESSLRRKPLGTPPGAIEVAKTVYQQEGTMGFFRGLGICNVRAFVVNAVQVCRQQNRTSDMKLTRAVGSI